MEQDAKARVKALPIVNDPSYTPITSEKWAKTHKDYKGINVSMNGKYKYRSMIINGALTPVFLSDKKPVPAIQ